MRIVWSGRKQGECGQPAVLFDRTAELVADCRFPRPRAARQGPDEHGPRFDEGVRIEQEQSPSQSCSAKAETSLKWPCLTLHDGALLFSWRVHDGSPLCVCTDRRSRGLEPAALSHGPCLSLDSVGLFEAWTQRLHACTAYLLPARSLPLSVCNSTSPVQRPRQ